MPHFYPLQNEVKKSPGFAAKILQASCAAKATWVELEIPLVFQNPPEEKGDTYTHKNRSHRENFDAKNSTQDGPSQEWAKWPRSSIPCYLGLCWNVKGSTEENKGNIRRLAIFGWWPIVGWRFLQQFCRGENINILRREFLPWVWTYAISVYGC